MEDKFEKKFRAFLPYIIIIAAVFLFVPALLVIFKNTMALNYIVLIGILPLTALGCCFHYSYFKENDFYLSLVAPIIWIPSMFLYGVIRDSVLRAIIYLVAYFICGYLGLLLGDILNPKDKAAEKKSTKRQHEDDVFIEDEAANAEDVPKSERKSSRRTPEKDSRNRSRAAHAPRRVSVDESAPRHFAAEDPYEDETLDTSTTTEDIDAILNEIHNRRSGD